MPYVWHCCFSRRQSFHCLSAKGVAPMMLIRRACTLIAGAVLALACAGSVRAADTTVTISQGGDADTLSPLSTTITPTFNVLQHVYERLADFGTRPGDYEPKLAVSWKRIN